MWDSLETENIFYSLSNSSTKSAAWKRMYLLTVVVILVCPRSLETFVTSIPEFRQDVAKLWRILSRFTFSKPCARPRKIDREWGPGLSPCALCASLFLLKPFLHAGAFCCAREQKTLVARPREQFFTKIRASVEKTGFYLPFWPDFDQNRAPLAPPKKSPTRLPAYIRILTNKNSWIVDILVDKHPIFSTLSRAVYIPIHMETLWCGQSYITTFPIPIKQGNLCTRFWFYSPNIPIFP